MKRILGAIALSVGLVAGAQAADDFPSETLTIIVPYAPGGSSDVLARAVGQAISEETGTTVIIDNRPGGGTIIGAQRLLSQKPDGHTVFVTAASFVINSLLMDKLPFDAHKDFQGVGLLATNPHLLVVNSKVPATDLDSFVSWANSHDGTYSSFGNGSSGHLGFELLKRATDIDMLHVPYKGSAPATLAVMTGEVDATLGDVGVVAPHLADGKIKPIAVTGDERLSALPDIPTFKEAGLPEFSSQTWLGALTRAEVPADRVEKLNQLFADALQTDTVKQVLAAQSMSAGKLSPAEFTDFMRAEEQKYDEVIKAAGISIQ